MFEKEAKNYALKTHCASCWQKDADGEYACIGLEYCNRHKDRCKDWQKGAEFGYNKANEWHYVSKGEMPTDEKTIFIYLGTRFMLGWYKFGFWYSNDGEIEEDVIAWKEIVLPKESE